ncbi:MAG: hypothetical protein CDV28_10929 [Candidatus Electronema aureum]|uniref:Uncharacterized protein n=1 Tax=Candidatus Electronema aureum TaxID=2005002 RepID=A0A521G2G2_9BACT|nr:MAG: hypothetical protein CDV28_10929 [Candidatus Electronema aureum]
MLPADKKKAGDDTIPSFYRLLPVVGKQLYAADIYYLVDMIPICCGLI